MAAFLKKKFSVVERFQLGTPLSCPCVSGIEGYRKLTHGKILGH